MPDSPIISDRWVPPPVCQECYGMSGGGPACFDHLEASSVKFCPDCGLFLCSLHHYLHLHHWTTSSHETIDVASVPSPLMQQYLRTHPELFPVRVFSEPPLCRDCYDLVGADCFQHSAARGAVFCGDCESFLCTAHHLLHQSHWTTSFHTTTHIASMSTHILQKCLSKHPEWFSDITAKIEDAAPTAPVTSSAQVSSAIQVNTLDQDGVPTCREERVGCTRAPAPKNLLEVLDRLTGNTNHSPDNSVSAPTAEPNAREGERSANLTPPVGDRASDSGPNQTISLETHAANAKQVDVQHASVPSEDTPEQPECECGHAVSGQEALPPVEPPQWPHADSNESVAGGKLSPTAADSNEGTESLTDIVLLEECPWRKSPGGHERKKQSPIQSELRSSCPSECDHQSPRGEDARQSGSGSLERNEVEEASASHAIQHSQLSDDLLASTSSVSEIANPVLPLRIAKAIPGETKLFDAGGELPQAICPDATPIGTQAPIESLPDGEGEGSTLFNDVIGASEPTKSKKKKKKKKRIAKPEATASEVIEAELPPQADSANTTLPIVDEGPDAAASSEGVSVESTQLRPQRQAAPQLTDAQPLSTNPRNGRFGPSYTIPVPNLSETSEILLPLDGIPLKVLREFVFGRCDGREALQGLTTRDVCERYIKPDTMRAQTSYCELLKKEGHPEIRAATVFVSHAWDDLFLEVVDALLDHFNEDIIESEGDVVLWFDLFSRNQHDKTAITTEWLNEVLRPGIVTIGRTALVLASGECRPLHRTWCLFEVLCALGTCGKQILVATANAAEVLKAVVQKIGAWTTINDIERSETSDPGDKACILRCVLGLYSSYFLANNHLDHLIAMGMIGMNLMRTFGTEFCDIDEKQLQTLLWMAAVVAHKKDYKAAVGLAQQTVNLCLDTVGERDPFTMRAETQIVQHLFDDGDYESALSSMEIVLEKQMETLGQSHEDTLRSMHLLGLLFARIEDLTEAEKMFQTVSRRRRDTLGLNHPDTLDSLVELSFVQKLLQKESEAFAVTEEICSAQYTPRTRLHILLAMGTQAILHVNRGKLDEAQRLVDIAHVKWKEFRASDDPQIMLESKIILARAYLKREQNEKALPLLVEGHAGKQMWFGNEDEETLALKGDLVSCYSALSMVDAATAMAIEILEAIRQQCGEKDSRTLDALTRVGWCHLAQCEIEKAMTMFQTALQGAVDTVGPTAPLAERAACGLSMCYIDKSRPEEAEKLLRQSGRPFPTIAMVRLGVSYLMQEKFSQGEAVLAEAWEKEASCSPLQKTASETLYALVVSYVTQKQYDRAISFGSESVRFLQEQGVDDRFMATVEAAILCATTAKAKGEDASPPPIENFFRDTGLIGGSLTGYDFNFPEPAVPTFDYPSSRDSRQRTAEERRSLRETAKRAIDDSRFGEAEPLCRRLVKLQSEAYGDTHIVTMEAATLLAEACVGLKKYDEAERLFGDTMDTLEGTVGSAHAQTVQTTFLWAQYLVHRNKMDEGKRVLTRLLKRLTAKYGKHDIRVLTTKLRLVDVFAEQGRIEQAKKLGEEAVKEMEVLYGPEHETTLATKEGLIQRYMQLELYHDALRVAEETLAGQTKILGASDKATQETAEKISSLRQLIADDRERNVRNRRRRRK